MRRQTSIRVGGKRTIKLSREQFYELRQDVAAVLGESDARDQCYCPCHQGHFPHVDPCCRRCPVCGRNILPDAYEAHTARHAVAGEEASDVQA